MIQRFFSPSKDSHADKSRITSGHLVSKNKRHYLASLLIAVTVAGCGGGSSSAEVTPPVQPPVEPPTEPPVEPPTEPPVEPPTEPPVEPPTEPPVEPPTEPPVEPPTEPPVEPPTDQSSKFDNQLIASAANAELCITQQSNQASLSNCSHSAKAQRWRYQPETQQVINCESSQCLASLGINLIMEDCRDETRQQWHYANDQFTQSGFAIDFDQHNTAVILYPSHSQLNQQWVVPSIVQRYISANDQGAAQYPIALDGGQNLAIKLESFKDALNRLTPLDKPLPYPRDVSQFPGEIESNTRRIDKVITIDREYFEPRHSGWPESQHWVSTGLYAGAGDVVEIVLPTGSSDQANQPTANLSSTNQQGLFALVNVHTDKLSASSHNVASAFQLNRYGNVTQRIALAPGVNRLRSQYGGQIIIESRVSLAAQVAIEFRNVVAAPHFKLGRDSLEDWPSIAQQAAPWGVLEGKNVLLDISKQHLQTIADPVALLTTFDRVVELIRDLAGFEPDSTFGPHRPSTLKQRIVADEQISVGFAHAGYPIMTSPGWQLHELDAVALNGWGNWHEIGHNHQQFCLWSQDFGIESTVNLFSLYVEKAFTGGSRIIHEKRYTNAIGKLQSISDFSFERDADVWDKLVFFMQIVHAYPDKGFDIIRQLNRRYREMTPDQQTYVCNVFQASYNKTYELLSDIIGEDIGRHFSQWGVPIDAETYQQVSQRHPAQSVDISAINPE
ncbi:hypothetical protein DXX93_12670 [Thalassotalea euphylliae]|uniref:Peptidase M60 domain-containing protein n=1 Tax=Thalassotalea euphylliae TaxID=1655234 RepID=A0A3E0TS78_9GAMM|nr:M60 family metallopeptidase [Thalassotalea euphylliae]REL27333.1 hypothetical protein DXX93_12670 [Thalassotalea euphylliae]